MRARPTTVCGNTRRAAGSRPCPACAQTLGGCRAPRAPRRGRRACGTRARPRQPRASRACRRCAACRARCSGSGGTRRLGRRRRRRRPPPRHGIPYGADLQAAPGEGALSRPKTRAGDARAKRHRICVCLDRKGRAPAAACGDCRLGARRLRVPSTKSWRGRQSGIGYSWPPASDSVAAFSMLPPRRRLRRFFGASSAIRPVPVLRQYRGCGPACIEPPAIAYGWRCAVSDIRVACPVGRPRGEGWAGDRCAVRVGFKRAAWREKRRWQGGRSWRAAQWRHAKGGINGALGSREGDRGGRRPGQSH